MMRRVLKWAVALVLIAVLAWFARVVIGIGPGNFARLVLDIGRTYDQVPPEIPALASGPAILIFSKTNGFRDDAQTVAANHAIAELARTRGWASFTTENAAVFNLPQLKRFDAVVWNSVSGDVLTAPQRAAFRTWLEQGGGFVGLHGSGGDPSYAWRWYVDDLIGAQFVGHTTRPQFQRATLIVEDRDHPATRHLAPTWVRSDEWYSFAASPRGKGYRILARLDERTYSPVMKKFLPFGHDRNIAMGTDHPVIWSHCVGNGRVFYSALGHQPSAYEEPAHLQMIEGAMAWAAGLEGSTCRDGLEMPRPQ